MEVLTTPNATAINYGFESWVGSSVAKNPDGLVGVVLAGIDVDAQLRLRRRRHPNHRHPGQAESRSFLPPCIEFPHNEITFAHFPAVVKFFEEWMPVNSGVEGELSDLQKQATRRSAETVAMTLVKTKWQSREFLDRWDAKFAALEEEAEERDR